MGYLLPRYYAIWKRGDDDYYQRSPIFNPHRKVIRRYYIATCFAASFELVTAFMSTNNVVARTACVALMFIVVMLSGFLRKEMKASLLWEANAISPSERLVAIRTGLLMLFHDLGLKRQDAFKALNEEIDTYLKRWETERERLLGEIMRIAAATLLSIIVSLIISALLEVPDESRAMIALCMGGALFVVAFEAWLFAGEISKLVSNLRYAFSEGEVSKMKVDLEFIMLLDEDNLPLKTFEGRDTHFELAPESSAKTFEGFDNRCCDFDA